MSHIKKFEAFNHRIPKTVSDAEWQKKLDSFGTEPFNQKEIEFFKKLKKENEKSIYNMDVESDKTTHTVSMQIYPTGEGDDLIDIDITKLKDDWYLIYEPGIDKFICDEWDEVLGYLGSQTNLRF
jgi:hypothetical protein